MQKLPTIKNQSNDGQTVHCVSLDKAPVSQLTLANIEASKLAIREYLRVINPAFTHADTSHAVHRSESEAWSPLKNELTAICEALYTAKTGSPVQLKLFRVLQRVFDPAALAKTRHDVSGFQLGANTVDLDRELVRNVHNLLCDPACFNRFDPATRNACLRMLQQMRPESSTVTTHWSPLPDQSKITSAVKDVQELIKEGYLVTYR